MGTVTRTEQGEERRSQTATDGCRQLRAKNHTVLQIGAAELISILAYVEAIYPSIYILHPPISYCQSVLCESNPIDTINFTAAPSTGRVATDPADTKRCACLYTQMRLFKPSTDLTHVARDLNLRTAFDISSISALWLRTAALLAQF